VDGLRFGWKEVSPVRASDATPYGNLLRVEIDVIGPAAVDDFHIQSMSEDKRNPFSGGQVGQLDPSRKGLRLRRPSPPESA
jgi:hypothetical protein